MASRLVAFSPQGFEIVSTLETILGTCGCRVTRKGGKVEVEHFSETDVDWNTQETVERDGQLVFIDSDSNEVLERDIVWKRQKVKE